MYFYNKVLADNQEGQHFDLNPNLQNNNNENENVIGNNPPDHPHLE
jgi:hypothetical protein